MGLLIVSVELDTGLDEALGVWEALVPLWGELWFLLRLPLTPFRIAIALSSSNLASLAILTVVIRHFTITSNLTTSLSPLMRQFKTPSVDHAHDVTSAQTPFGIHHSYCPHVLILWALRYIIHGCCGIIIAIKSFSNSAQLNVRALDLTIQL